MDSTRNRRLIATLALAGCAAAFAVVASPTMALAGGPVSGTVRSATPVNVRSGPSTQHAKLGTVARGAKVTTVCQVSGEHARGPVRNTAMWNRLTTGKYVSDAYILRARGVPNPPRCQVDQPKPVQNPTGGTVTPSPSRAAWLRQIAGPAQQGYREYKVPASVTMAQAILESGWGQSKLTANDKNYFGIKCFNGKPGTIAVSCHTYVTTECEGTRCYKTTAVFRVYRSATDSFRDHSNFLVVNRRYRFAFQYSNDPNRFAAEIRKAGYATDPKYTDKLIALMRAYNLYQYDR